MRLELEKQNTTQDPYCKGHTASSRKLQRVDWLSVISVTDSAWSFWMQSKLHPPGDPLQDKTNTRNHLPQLSVPGLDESESESDSWVILTTELFSAFFSSRMFFSTFYLALVFTKSSVQLHCQGSEKLLSSFFLLYRFLFSSVCCFIYINSSVYNMQSLMCNSYFFYWEIHLICNALLGLNKLILCFRIWALKFYLYSVYWM